MVLNEGVTRASAVAGIMVASVGIHLMFPQIAEIGRGVGLGMVPFPVLILLGLALGALANLVLDRLGGNVRKILKSIAVAYLIWALIGLISALSASEGGIIERLQNDRILGLWFITFYALVAMAPGSFAGYAVVSGSKAAMSGAVGSMMAIPLICMIYSEARSNLLLDQGVLQSIVSVWGLVLFVESMGMMRRIKEFEGSFVPPPIMTRNIVFLMLFSALSSMFAVAPFLFSFKESDVYELGTIYGRAMTGLLIMIPVAILALIRRRG